MQKIAAIVAMDKNHGIGFQGNLPWHLPEDLARFKKLTVGGAVLMGRKTWESLPEKFRPLPNRQNIVLTRDPQSLVVPDNVFKVESVEAGLKLVEGEKQVWIIGGGEIYRLALPFCNELYVTDVEGSFVTDASFPQFTSDFQEVDREKASGCSFVKYTRMNSTIS